MLAVDSSSRFGVRPMKIIAGAVLILAGAVLVTGGTMADATLSATNRSDRLGSSVVIAGLFVGCLGILVLFSGLINDTADRSNRKQATRRALVLGNWVDQGDGVSPLLCDSPAN
jgi:uncharacterized membrane protein